MNIEKLHGTSTRLYQLVAPLVMSPPVLRQNNNYPFKTSDHHVWFVALEEEKVRLYARRSERLVRMHRQLLRVR